MKNPLILLLSIFGTAAISQAAMFFDDFNGYTPGDAVGDATYTARYSNASTDIDITANGGISNTQGWSFASDQTVIRTDTAFDLTSGAPGTATASIFFQYGTAAGIATPQIGFTGATTGNFTGAGDLSARLTTGSVLQLRSNNTGIVSGSALTLTNNNWYQLTYELTQTATTNEFTGTVSLFNASAAGVVGSQVGSSVSTTLTNATLYGDTTLYAGVRKNSNLVVMDNFGVSQVPEPSTAILFGLCGLGILFRRRRA